jgi:hypothetical protein
MLVVEWAAPVTPTIIGFSFSRLEHPAGSTLNIEIGGRGDIGTLRIPITLISQKAE